MMTLGEILSTFKLDFDGGNRVENRAVRQQCIRDQLIDYYLSSSPTLGPSSYTNQRVDKQSSRPSPRCIPSNPLQPFNSIIVLLVQVKRHHHLTQLFSARNRQRQGGRNIIVCLSTSLGWLPCGLTTHLLSRVYWAKVTVALYYVDCVDQVFSLPSEFESSPYHITVFFLEFSLRRKYID